MHYRGEGVSQKVTKSDKGGRGVSQKVTNSENLRGGQPKSDKVKKIWRKQQGLKVLAACKVSTAYICFNLDSQVSLQVIIGMVSMFQKIYLIRGGVGQKVTKSDMGGGGVSQKVTKSDMGGRGSSLLSKRKVTSFMNSPLKVIF